MKVKEWRSEILILTILTAVKPAYVDERRPPNRTNRTLFDPNASSKKIILPSQVAATASSSHPASGIPKERVKHTKPISSSTAKKLENLKEMYGTLCQYEKYWAENPKVLDFAKRLQACELYNTITATDYKLSLKYDLDSRQWKNVVYNIFNTFRSQFTEMETEQLNAWNHFLNKAAELLAELANKLAAKKSKIPVWVSPLAHLGDICRYQAEYMSLLPQVDADERWLCAQNWYEKASFISPGNGLLWNQLGIVSRARGLYLAAIMYYMRALCVKKPFLSAKDSLVELLHFVENEYTFENSANGKSLSVEAQLDDSRILCETEIRFLRIQSAIYTKVGLDQFERNQATYTSFLIRAQPTISLLSESLEITWWFHKSVVTVCNFHLIDSSEYLDKDAKKIMLGYGMDSLASVLKTICQDAISSEGRNVYLCFIFLWLACQNLSENLVKRLETCWPIVVQFYLTLIPESYQEPADLNLENVLLKSAGLPEDLHSRTLLPVCSAHEFFVTQPEHEDAPKWTSTVISLKRRARIILLIGLFSQTHPRFSLVSKTKGGQVSLGGKKEFNFADFESEEEVQSEEEDGVESLEMDEQESRVVRDIGELIGETESLAMSSDMVDLKKRMESLVGGAKKILVPGETVIIFDTNCYLHDFSSVKKVMESQKWKIIVPLAVVTELDGLSQGESESGIKAAECLDYLFANVSKTFQVQTLRGTLLSSLAFLSEEWPSGFSGADDVILAVCKWHANVCLITNDINLRLKARTVGVPVLESAKQL